MFSASTLKSVLHWLECLLRLEVTWLTLMAVASCVRTQERNDVRVPEVAPNCATRCGWIANGCFCQAVTVFKGCFKTSHPKGGVLPSFLSSSYTWVVDCWSVAVRERQQPWLQVTEAGAEVLFSSPCSISCLKGRWEHSVSHLCYCWHGCSRIWRLLFFYILHNVSLFILPFCVTVEAGRVAA